MVYNYLSSRALLLIPLFMLVIGALAGPCMPCQASNRRDTPWDHRLAARGVYSPKITNPKHDTIWKPASDVNVTWDLHGFDKTSNSKGTLLLGYLEDGSESEHLDIEHPLASDFDISSGSMTIKCPEVAPGGEYIVVLIGDSGNRSPTFTIKK
ncbi:hypothetical protein HYPSUDRAFT_162094 [Hypholoma sublateritium FD-334 SS-4]|uniref:Uncharacterized protein n=1 Tax=Hypholoma sublateritium (strain FD-334 SS-4) TaxID=945553 RepID=A0A0D2P6R3_HYPSF|nr:hypothetical protein HYPSUDRAFT_162094 [Hypholoma sublateritium FD-334 SS-4]